mmetsp:Transcript_14134/g.29028  ORF Transcript_14134/g.29028 Transcript_14134/m.29028 type:complete len:250 (+) Transcript_14134:4115-4864(+)
MLAKGLLPDPSVREVHVELSSRLFHDAGMGALYHPGRNHRKGKPPYRATHLADFLEGWSRGGECSGEGVLDSTCTVYHVPVKCPLHNIATLLLEEFLHAVGCLTREEVSLTDPLSVRPLLSELDREDQLKLSLAELPDLLQNVQSESSDVGLFVAETNDAGSLRSGCPLRIRGPLQFDDTLVLSCDVLAPTVCAVLDKGCPKLENFEDDGEHRGHLDLVVERSIGQGEDEVGEQISSLVGFGLEEALER